MKKYYSILMLLLCSSAQAQTTIFSEDFESGTLNQFTAGNVLGTFTWQTTTNRGSDPGHSASNSAYFGDPANFDYDSGLQEGATITTGPIDLSSNGFIIMTFNYFLETEGSLLTYDQALVEISTNGSTYTPLFGNGYIAYNQGNWREAKYDLSDYAGNSTVYIRIGFNSIDDIGNNFEGFYVDDVTIYEPGNTQSFQTYGHATNDDIFFATEARDGGILIGGRTYYNTFSDPFILHLDENGDTVYSQLFSAPNDLQDVAGVSQSLLGGYTFSGEYYNGPLGDADQYGARAGAPNVADFVRVYGASSQWAYAKEMAELSNNTLVIAGTDNSEMYITNTSYTGVMNWTRRINPSNNVYVEAVKEGPSGNIYVLYRHGDLVGMWVLNTSGTTVWRREYDSGTQENTRGFMIDSSGDIYIVGYAFGVGSGGYDASLLKLSSTGTVLWCKAYGGSNTERGSSVSLTSDGGIILATSTESFGAGQWDMGLLKLDANGVLQWGKAYGGTGDEHPYYVRGLGNGDLLLVGSTDSYGQGSSDIMVVRTDNNGYTTGCWREAAFAEVSYTITATTPFYTENTVQTTATDVLAVGPSPMSIGNPVPNTSFAVTDPLCNGDDGSIDLTVTGGAFPYSFQWSTGGTAEDVFAVGAGTHFVQITDAKGCQMSDTTVMTEPTAITTGVVGTNVDCYGSQNGAADLTVGGGTAPYTYSWTNGGSTEDLSGLSGGFYQVTVTDDNGCTELAAVSINEPLPVVAAVSGVTDVTCNGACDGTLTATASGGTGTLNYLWNDGSAQTTATANTLCPGNFVVTVTDANGCSTIASGFITEPDALQTSITGNGTECGLQNGAAQVGVMGGTGTYNYSWSSGSNTDQEVGLDIGTYTVTITDANGCQILDSATIGYYVVPQNVCMVTVDSANRNLVVWEKPTQPGIAGYNIYRDVTGTYVLAGYVDHDSLSQFVDENPSVNPDITSYRYKVTKVDSCGNESALSDFHETIHVTSNVGTSNEVNLIWDSYEGFSYSYYRILRDSTGTDNWEVLDSVSNFNFTYTDLTPPSVAEYIIEVITPSTCSSTRANHNTTRSNRAAPIGPGEPTGIGAESLFDLNLYPNPNQGQFEVVFGSAVSDQVQMTVLDLQGRVIQQRSISVQKGANRMTVDMEHVERGMYQFVLTHNKFISSKRFTVMD